MSEQSPEEHRDQLPPAVKDRPPRPRPTPEQRVGRALRLKCPRCGEGELFEGWFRMPERCGVCRLKYERAPGYFLGAAYINYGAIALLTTVSFIILRFGFGITTTMLKYPLFAVAMVLPFLTFRYARGLWLALDSHFDKSVLADETAAEGDH
ncbi:MAG: DUF983 domain-containing protein [Planctomycetaceae bacterium]|nr:DUF983 domain-containing protein [Planctomycetaceae bacterium]